MSLVNEQLVLLAEAAAYFPVQPGPTPHLLNLYATRGYRGVQLETILQINKRYTSAEAVARFIAATSVAPAKKKNPKP